MSYHVSHSRKVPVAQAVAWVFLGCTFAVGVTVLYVSNPAGWCFFPRCPFYVLTGLYCPGCGTLRAFHHLLHGNILVALDLNPLAVIALPLIGLHAATELVCRIKGKDLPYVAFPVAWSWIILAVILAYWILRNIPFYPFKILAP